MQFYEDLEWQVNGHKCYACKNGVALSEGKQLHTEDGWQLICPGCYDKYMKWAMKEINYEEMGASRHKD